MHQIGETGRVTLEGTIFEVELKSHHQGSTYQQCEEDCPEGWQIPTYFLLQSMRNDSAIRDQFGLKTTWEYVQNPDAISRGNGYVARFYAISVGAFLNCSRVPADRDASLGVRFAREISQ